MCFQLLVRSLIAIFCAAGLVACGVQQTQSEATSPMPGFADAVARLSSDIEQGRYPGLTSMFVSLEGHRLSEAFAPGVSPSETHDVRSATKSITAILVGELLEDGLVDSVDVPLSELLPDRFAMFDSSDPRLSITLADAMTMRTGLACDDWVPASVGHEDKMYETRDWVAFVLGQPVSHEVGEHFSYCTGGVILVGEAIEALSGRPVAAYAGERLFQPIGATGVEWAYVPDGGTDTGGHLRITASDFHQIGVLVASKGLSGGKRVIQEQWLHEMLREQTDVYERRQKYGYLWWIDDIELRGKTLRVVYAHGNGGNFIFLVPKLHLVATFTGVNFGSRLQFQPVEILETLLLPALVGDQVAY